MPGNVIQDKVHVSGLSFLPEKMVFKPLKQNQHYNTWDDIQMAFQATAGSESTKAFS